MLRGRYTSWGGHGGGACHLPQTNTWIANWFLYGMIDDEAADWYAQGEQRPITFEKRLPEVMVPQMHKLMGTVKLKPDLVILSSLFWDERLIRDHAKLTHLDRGNNHGFLFNELAWHRSRLRELIDFVRANYGTPPIMYRTRQIRKHTAHDELLRIFQLDESCRAVALEMGVKEFTWGDKLEGYVKYYDDDQHFGTGPNTWLFGE